VYNLVDDFILLCDMLISDLFMQDNDLSEFDESREIIESLVDEYKACESPDYIKWGMEVSSMQSKSCSVHYINC
jgi:hypothetical protein